MLISQNSRAAITPAVISASRATDIPAFHVGWLLERLEAGYCDWVNPFNASQLQRVSFAKCKAFVFWSKNPAPLIPHLSKFDAKGIKYYFHFTLNDYEKERLEPGIPPLAERIETFQKLAGICPVIWRYDPIILGAGLNVKEHLRRIEALMPCIAQYTDKFVFSFVDIRTYKRVEKRLKNFNQELREPELQEMKEFARGLAELNSTQKRPLRLGICGEKEDFSRFSIAKNSCIDPKLLEMLTPLDKNLLPTQADLMGTLAPRFPLKSFDASKDRGQRKFCGCAKSKDIGNYRKHSCSHHCVYCYAGHGNLD